MRTTSTHVYFWGGEFSNWLPCQFKYKEQLFDNSEQAFMWEKAMTFNDHETAKKILNEPDPSFAKKLGREVKNYNDKKWEDIRYKIMVDVNIEKFSQNSNLKTVLLSTKDRTLVEASPYDKIWGVGLKENDKEILDEKNWDGQNLLGKALMEVREILNK